MFEPVIKDHSNAVRIVFRGSYVLVSGLVSAGYLFCGLFPGGTKGERFGRFVVGSMLLVVSLILSALVFPYVVWKLAKYDKPVFWGSALLVAAFPALLLFAITLWGLA